MITEHLQTVFQENASKTAIIWNDNAYSYSWLIAAVEEFRQYLSGNDIREHSVVSLLTDFSPNAIALLIALLKHRCVVAPISTSVSEKIAEYTEMAQAQFSLYIDKTDKISLRKNPFLKTHSLLKELELRKHPGLIIFSSGSTGKSKAAVHDFYALFNKHMRRKKAMRVLAFLLFDHIGGLNTLFYVLANAGCVIIPEDRTPEKVCDAIAGHRAQALTTSPTFLNLLLLSECYQHYDLSSLQIINYGAEAMPATTLEKLNQSFPHIRFSQAYGLSEIGVLAVRSQSSNSLFIKIDDPQVKTRINNGMLELKAPSSMLGYLNAESAFTADGWLITGDAVEVAGDYLRVLGRQSEMINVGGEKVYPAEIESVLQAMSGVQDVVVYRENSPIVGQLVAAKIRLQTNETLSQFRSRMRDYCKTKLPAYKVPQKIILTDKASYGERFKKMRSTQ